MNVHPLTRSALLRADLFRLVSGVFDRPTPSLIAAVTDLAGDLADSLEPELPGESALMVAALELRQAAGEADPRRFETEYHTLFATDVMVSPYEGSYQRTDRGAVIGDVCAYYAAFGLSPREGEGPPDALKTEAAWIGWAGLKEAYALENGQEEEAEITREAVRNFVQDHFGRWYGAFIQKLRDTSGHLYLLAGADLLAAAMAWLIEDLDIEDIAPLTNLPAGTEPDEVVCPVSGPAFE